MFTTNDDLSIYATRGDTVFFAVSADDDGLPYKFQAGDVLRLKIFEKKKAENVILEKTFGITGVTEQVDILLTEADTKIGEVISKPVDYWYEIELNPFTNPQTIIGYDDDGAKIFRLFPEGADSEVVEPEPEDIPVVDDELDMTSTRPVQNQAVSRAIVRLEADCQVTKKAVKDKAAEMDASVSYLVGKLATESARIDNIVALGEGSTTGDAELIDGRIDAFGYQHGSVGAAIRATTLSGIELQEATKMAQPVIPFMDRLEIGFVQISEDGLTFKDYTNYVRTKNGATIHLDAGDKIVCSNDTRVYTGYLSGGAYVQNTWTSNFVAPVSADYVMLFSYYDSSDIVSVDTFLKNITITRADSYEVRIANLTKETKRLASLENTYFSNCIIVVGDALTTNAMRYCAKLSSPVCGLKVSMPDTVRYAIQGYTTDSYNQKVYDSGWLTEDGFTVFEDRNLHYVVIFIRLDDTEPTAEDRANTIVLQSLDLTPILDKVSVLSTDTFVGYDGSGDLIRSVAHRGYSEVAPENTTPAFVMAKQAGFGYVETDIQVTKDGKYVCIHDGTISKYTNGAETGAVAEYTLEELKSMDFGSWKDDKWAGLRVMTFEEFIVLCKKLGVKAYIELKYTHSDSDIAYYLEYVKRIGMASHCVWRGASYNRRIRQISADAVIAYDASSIMTEEKVKSIVAEFAPMFFHNDASYITEDIVNLCHANGVRIEAYTVNNKETLVSLADMGIDGVTTDKLVAGKVLFENLI